MSTGLTLISVSLLRTEESQVWNSVKLRCPGISPPP